MRKQWLICWLAVMVFLSGCVRGEPAKVESVSEESDATVVEAIA
ncbi:hypothetical protein [Anoxynatronum buryatiense]|uniref:Uncharacterized protein n=1 Tax=Anoxynatronum buryatiense TaxID=489973 RepID=A0AA45WYL1_9CLOT|nr:hypothetical protein [Anoxynatronum buryatiense]SMP69305.1 hypothetical protein SAMN06296020_11863 [Anoxynatronum buryatiense]